MSGYKRATVSISQEEYDRLREAETRLRTLPKISPETNAELERLTKNLLQNNLRDIQQRQKSFEAIIGQMDNYVRDLESRTNQAMVEFEANTIAEVQDYAGRMWGYYDQLINQHAQQFQAIITENHRQYQAELIQLTRRIRRMGSEKQKKRELAETWLDAAMQLSAFIDQNYAHACFTPGRMDRLDQQLNQARINLESGLNEAVVVSTQQLYLAYSDLRVELECLQNEWQMLYQAALEAVIQELNLIEQSRVVSAVDLDGNPLPYTIEVNEWCDGRLDVIEAELTNLYLALEDHQQLPGSDELRHWLEDLLPRYHQDLEKAVLDARVNVLNSQLRINIADLVVQALRDQGFALNQSEYEQNDQRMGYDVSLLNLAGSEVVVKVEPAGYDIGENALSIQSFDQEEKTEHELRQRWLEVSRSLEKYGLDVGQYVHEDVTGGAAARPVLTGAQAPVRQRQAGRSGVR